ncbi:MAG: cellulose biosynthesis protein BcsS [Parvularculaceae bacterium]
MRKIVFSLLAIGVCSAARAEPYHGVAFAGGSVSDNDSGYGGVIVAAPGASLGHGFAVKAAVNGGRYDYLGGVGHVEAKYYGGQLAFVYQWSGAWGWANF